MRLAEVVRIGGKLALAVGFVSSNLVFSNSLLYFTGYQSTTFGVTQASDPFSKQNVPFTPAVSMVSGSSLFTGSSTTTSSTGVAGSYGFSPAASQSSSSTGTATSTSSGNPLFMGSGGSTSSLTVPNSPPSVPVQTTAPSGSSSSSLFLFSGSPLIPGSGAGTPALSTQTIAGSSLLFSPVSVQMGAVAVKSNVNVSASALNPADPTGMPEPSTWASMGAGLAFLLFKFRRR